MSFRKLLGNLTECELLPFINEHDIPPFLQYSHLVFQPLISSDSHDEICNPDSKVDLYNDNLTCDYFDLDNEDFEKIRNPTAPISCSTLASLNIRSVSKIFETFQMEISKLNFETLGLFETRLSSETEMLHHVPSFDLFTNNCSTLGGDVLLYLEKYV